MMDYEHYAPPRTRTYKSASNTVIEASGRFSRVEALKIYANVYKGRPPLKPNKGNNGYVSWLCGVGKPNSGAGDKPIELRFSWICSGNDRVTQDEELAGLFQRQHGSLKQTNRRTWIAAGTKAERAPGIVELSVPLHHALNSAAGGHSRGTFFLVNEASAPRLTLATPLDDLRSTLQTQGAAVAQWEVRYARKNQACAGPDHPGTFTMTVPKAQQSLHENYVNGIIDRAGLERHGHWKVLDIDRDAEQCSLYLDATCDDYTQFKHAARNLKAKCPFAGFAPPDTWEQNWEKIKHIGQGGRTFNAVVPPGGPFGSSVLALEHAERQ